MVIWGRTRLRASDSIMGGVSLDGQDLSESLASFSEAWEFLLFRGRYQQETELGPEIHPFIDLAIPQSVRLGEMTLTEDLAWLRLEAPLLMNKDPQKEIDCLLIPEIFLDDKCRIVAGSVVFLQSKVPLRFGPFAAYTQPESILDGRFVVNLDDLRDFPATIRTEGRKLYVFTTAWGPKEFKEVKQWVFDESESAVAGTKPSRALMSIQVRANCSYCTQGGIPCQCCGLSLEPTTGKPFPSSPSWSVLFSSYMMLPALRLAMTVTVEIPSYSGISLGWSTDLIMNGTSRFTSAPTDMRAKYIKRKWFIPLFREPIRTHKKDQKGSPRDFRSAPSGGDLRRDQETHPQESKSGRENSKGETRLTYEEHYTAHQFMSREGSNVSGRRQRKYNCQICDKRFVSSGNVGRHRKMVHENIKRHFCVECGKGFYARRDRELHIRSVHDSETGASSN